MACGLLGPASLTRWCALMVLPGPFTARELNTLLAGWTTFFSSSCLLKDFLVASNFGQLWIKLCRFLVWTDILHSAGYIAGSVTAGLCGKIVLSFVRNRCPTLRSRQQ